MTLTDTQLQSIDEQFAKAFNEFPYEEVVAVFQQNNWILCFHDANSTVDVPTKEVIQNILWGLKASASRYLVQEPARMYVTVHGGRLAVAVWITPDGTCGSSCEFIPYRSSGVIYAYEQQ